LTPCVLVLLSELPLLGHINNNVVEVVAWFLGFRGRLDAKCPGVVE
jgi:hypothetical protein